MVIFISGDDEPVHDGVARDVYNLEKTETVQ